MLFLIMVMEMVTVMGMVTDMEMDTVMEAKKSINMTKVMHTLMGDMIINMNKRLKDLPDMNMSTSMKDVFRLLILERLIVQLLVDKTRVSTMQNHLIQAIVTIMLLTQLLQN